MLGFLKELFTINQVEDPKEKYSQESIQKFVEKNINNSVVSSIDEYGKTPEEKRYIRKRKELFNRQLNLCGLGDIAAKNYIKDWITDLITQQYGINADNINYAINFDFPSAYDMFCILLNRYFEEYRYDALKKFILINKLHKLKNVNGELMYAITDEDIQDIFEREIRDTTKIRYYEKLSILVQRVYENTQGLGCVDEIRDMNCETISIGVSGIPIDFISKINDFNIKNNEMKEYPMSYDSVFLNIGGREIALQFMGFRSQRGLERVCRKIYKFNNQRQFTQADGITINNMADFTRAVVFRPPHSDGWAAFMRKYDVDGDLDELIIHENADIVKELIDILMKSKSNICFSGQQGVGKTTMLVGAIKKLYATSTIRCWEDFFETFLRFKTIFRNILTIRKTENINGEKGLDNFKKSNGQITVISEAADDQAKAYVIKSSLSASQCVYWTDHSIGEDEIVQTHRNACLNLGLFRDEDKAEEQVLNVLQWNIALDKDEEDLDEDDEDSPNDNLNENRFIRRLTEFIRVDTKEYNSNIGSEAFYENSRLFFEKRTNAKKYKTINIIEFDEEHRRYEVKNQISEEKQKYILSRLRKSDKKRFLALLERMEGELQYD
ncbi:hypothetical protein [uncultured Clostridium sp.]|uniref:hypothetical protein n=1 Tax=uncultured Clostridium sp. TaxID=59620 RepID=UPI0028E6FFEF|nr:hypothetical protein [uncultured Clostridium sp.]